MIVDDVLQFLKASDDGLELARGVGIEQNLAEQVVIFRHESAGDVEMAFECRARGVLMFHDAGKGEGGRKGYRQGVGDGVVVLGKGVFLDVEPEPRVEVTEEDAAKVVALLDDDGVLV